MYNLIYPVPGSIALHTRRPPPQVIGDDSRPGQAACVRTTLHLPSAYSYPPRYVPPGWSAALCERSERAEGSYKTWKFW